MSLCPACGVANREGARFCAECGSSLARVPDLDNLLKSEIEPIREKLGEKYQILHCIGRGGFSTVFLIKDKALERLCALKILSREQTLNPEAVERFKREARLYASLDHPNIVSVFDFGFHNHVAYIVFKYIDGITLHEHIKRCLPLGQTEILAIASDLAEILGYMHQRGIVHRDVKPENVMVQNADRKVILTDFGLAKKLDTSTVTSDGKILGSPHYFSPEQAKGEAVDARSDIYSLGITIFVMASGVTPFKGDTPYEVILKHIREPLPDLSRLRPDLHPDVHKLIRRCTEKDPRRRFQDAAELQAALHRIPAAKPDIQTEVIRRSHRDRGGRRRRVRPAFIALAAAAMTLMALFLLIRRPFRSPAAGEALNPGVSEPGDRVRIGSQTGGIKQSDPGKGNPLPAGATPAVVKSADEAAEPVVAVPKKTRREDLLPRPVETAGKGDAEKKSTASPQAKMNTERRPIPTEPGATPATKEEQKAPTMAPAAATGKKIEEKKEAVLLPPHDKDAEAPREIKTARIMDLPDALSQSYIRELGVISTSDLAGEFRVSGSMAVALGIDETGIVRLNSLNDEGVKVEPAERRSEIQALVKNRINGMKVRPPVDKAGAAVRIENWRITFRVGRDRQSLVLSRIN